MEFIVGWKEVPKGKYLEAGAMTIDAVDRYDAVRKFLDNAKAKKKRHPLLQYPLERYRFRGLETLVWTKRKEDTRAKLDLPEDITPESVVTQKNEKEAVAC